MAVGTRKQRVQWKLRCALGYTIGIRGYLLCWRGLVEVLQDPRDKLYALNRIDEMLSAATYIEKDIRRNLRSIR